MRASTHIIFALLLSILFLSIYKNFNPIIFIIITLTFSILPDIDYDKSKIGNNSLSWLLYHLFGHRQLIHSMLIPIMLFFMFFKFSITIAFAILLGYTSHLALDSLNKSGLKPLFPLKLHIKGHIKTNSIVEKMIFIILLIALLYLLLNPF